MRSAPAIVAMWATEQPPAPGAADADIPAGIAFQMQPYERQVFGPITFANVAGYVQFVLNRFDPKAAEAAFDRAKTSREASASPAEAVPRVTNANWGAGKGNVCDPDSSMLCAIAVLDPTAGSFENDLALVRTVAASAAASKDPYVFGWVDGTCELEWADAFDVQPPKLPTIVALSPKKRRFAGFVGGFMEADVRHFLAGILSGKRKTAPLSDVPLPTFSQAECDARSAEKAVGAADGAGGDAPAEEMEGADDLMAEILAEEAAAKEAALEEAKREVEEAKVKAKAEAEAAEAAAAAAKKKKKKKKKKSKSSDL